MTCTRNYEKVKLAMNLFDEIEGIQWRDCIENPLIFPPFPSPVIADPTFLPPDKTPDKKWHLFAHSLMGLHHFVSDDGIAWRMLDGLAEKKAMRPFLFVEDGTYYLFYEKFISFFPQRSRIEVRQSNELLRWGSAKVVLTPHLPWHRRTCGNPCVLKDGDEYKLYYSAALVFLKDCKFSEPEFIGVASSENVSGPFVSFPEPLIKPDKSDPYGNHGAGSIKVVQTKSGFAGFQNGIYVCRKKHTHSAIRLLSSQDGITWRGFDREPFLKPAGKGWKKAFVYACDVRQFEDELYLYYNARNGWLIGKECIGLCKGLYKNK